MTATEVTLELRLQQHRRELTAHCRRMLRSSFDAEDAVQETLVRAWRSFDRFEGRAALRTWLLRIATNVCLDMLRSRQRHPLPIDPTAVISPAAASTPLPPAAGARPDMTSAEVAWARPSPDGRGGPPVPGPEDLAMGRDASRRALLVLLQLLPPRQRAVLILHEVLRWKAAEVAELMGTTVAAVNSALQRARATIAARGQAAASDVPADPAHGDLLARYLDAFTHHDVRSLLALATSGAPADVGPGGPGRVAAW